MTMPTGSRAQSPYRAFAPMAVLLAAALFLFAGLALAQPGPDPDRYIVQFAERSNSDAARQAIARAGGQVLLELERVNAAAARIPARALKGLRNNPNIKLIEQDAPRFPMAQATPYGISMVQADQLSEGVNPADIKVCIIDSGLDGPHEDLQSSNRDGTNVSGSGNWNEDSCGHGSHVAGTIMAQNNSLGVVGVTPNVALHIIKVFDGEGCGWAYASSLVDAAYECGNAGADIINMSLGCSDSGRGGPWSCASATEDAAFQDLNDNFGILSIAAAGNDGSTNNSYPASYASVVSVAAVDSAGAVASFSQQNSAVELAAPGVAVRSTVPTGTGKEESLSVAGVGYEAIAMAGSPNITASGTLVDCGLGTATCSGASGAVCLIQRGDISFAEKVQACEAGGGVAAVIYNNEPGLFSGTVEGAGTGIPSVSISGADGTALAAGSSATVAVGPGNYAYFDGTSMATPHVAGVAALVWSQDTSWTNAQVRDALQKSALDLGAAGRDNAYGYGLVQAKAAVDYLGGGGDGGGGDPEPNSPPTANFTYSCTELACDFDGSDSTDSDGLIGSYAWDFGDGSTGTGVTSSHSYGADGTYTVTLTVTDDAGATATSTQDVTVAAAGDGGGDAPISLTATGYKVQGRHRIDLTWSGATSTNVDIVRDESFIATTANDGAYTDATNNRGGATYTYQVCEAGTSTCSDAVTVVF